MEIPIRDKVAPHAFCPSQYLQRQWDQHFRSALLNDFSSNGLLSADGIEDTGNHLLRVIKLRV